MVSENSKLVFNDEGIVPGLVVIERRGSFIPHIFVDRVKANKVHTVTPVYMIERRKGHYEKVFYDIRNPVSRMLDIRGRSHDLLAFQMNPFIVSPTMEQLEFFGENIKKNPFFKEVKEYLEVKNIKSISAYTPIGRFSSSLIP